MSRKQIFYSNEKAFKTLTCLCETFQNIRDILTVVSGEGFFLRPKIFSSLNIFWSMRRKVLIFVPMERARSSAPDKYLKHCYPIHKKFLETFEKKVYLKIQSKSRNFARIPIHNLEYAFLKSDKNCFLLQYNYFYVSCDPLSYTKR